jgi:beta-mannanase
MGVFVPGVPSSIQPVDDFSARVGVSPKIVMWFQSWSSTTSKVFPAATMDAVVARCAMPMITWEPWDWSMGVTQPTYSLKSIASGQHDAYVRQFAKDSARWGKPYYMRFAHEMNGDWYPWGIGVNGNVAADYVAAWRRVVGIFRAEGATNVRWVWAPNVVAPSFAPLTSVYPGDGYVDWVGIDGYNRASSTATWQTFTQVISATYSELSTLTQKPMMVSETGCSEVGGSKATWIRDAFATELPMKFPKVRALIWFNEKKSQDWPVTSSSAALQAYTEMAKAARNGARLP